MCVCVYVCVYDSNLDVMFCCSLKIAVWLIVVESVRWPALGQQPVPNSKPLAKCKKQYQKGKRRASGQHVANSELEEIQNSFRTPKAVHIVFQICISLKTY